MKSPEFHKKLEHASVSTNESELISLLADIRRRSIDLKKLLFNVEESVKSEGGEINEHTKLYIRLEAEGKNDISKDKAISELQKNGTRFANNANLFSECAPHYSSYLLSYVAKLKQSEGVSYQDEINQAKQFVVEYEKLPKDTTVSDIIPQAQIIGIQTREVKNQTLPNVRELARIALQDTKAVSDIALVLSEKERVEFLQAMPEENRTEISRALDVSVSHVLHQSFVEKYKHNEEGQETGEETEMYRQRREVRARIARDLEVLLGTQNVTEKETVKKMGEAMASLGDDTAQIFLDIAREEFDKAKTEGVQEHTPRVVKILVEEFNDRRGNDIALRLASLESTPRHMSLYLFRKLAKEEYIPKDIIEWFEEASRREKDVPTRIISEQKSLEVMKLVSGDLGVMPSREILEFINDDNAWKGVRPGEYVSIKDRISDVLERKQEFEHINDSRELVSLLVNDEKKAMMYYLIFGGTDRFDKANNYSFEKFKEILGLIDGLEIHQEPMQMFRKSLENGGLSKDTIQNIQDKLLKGHFPLEVSQSTQRINFQESSGNEIEQYSRELGVILGREQLGVLLLYPVYREFLEVRKSEIIYSTLLEKMTGAETFNDRLAVIEEIESAIPDIRQAAQKTIEPSWKALGEKDILNLSLENILNDQEVSVQGDVIVPKIDSKRVDLKRIKKELLVALKGENPALKSITNEIAKKKKARKNLIDGLVYQVDQNKKIGIQTNIDSVDKEIEVLEQKRKDLLNISSDERLSELSPDDRKIEIEKTAEEIRKISEKDRSAIFSYLLMQVVGEKRLYESDVNLVKEFESHLQRPFQGLAEAVTYSRGKGKTENVIMEMSYVDKGDRLLNAVRFADSATCCFSSWNYDQVIQHGQANKFWVASINKDPLSFILSIEEPSETASSEQENVRTIHKNRGFIFGNFGINDDGQTAILLNGVYYSKPITGKQQAEAFVRGIEQMFKGIPVKNLAIASQYGGGTFGSNMPKDFSKDPIEITRLRAIDDSSGKPETAIYDDLTTGNDLNSPHFYGGHVWHKNYE